MELSFNKRVMVVTGTEVHKYSGSVYSHSIVQAKNTVLVGIDLLVPTLLSHTCVVSKMVLSIRKKRMRLRQSCLL